MWADICNVIIECLINTKICIVNTLVQIDKIGTTKRKSFVKTRLRRLLRIGGSILNLSLKVTN